MHSPLFRRRSRSATWNPNDKGSTIVLSNSNRTADNGGTAAWAMVRATRRLAVGVKWYWEVKVVNPTTLTVGIANASAPLASYLGADANGYSYQTGTGYKITNASPVAYGAVIAANDVLGIKLDLVNGTLEYLVNNVSQGTAYTGLSGEFFPATGCSSTGQGILQSNPTSMTYGVPSGYTPVG